MLHALLMFAALLLPSAARGAEVEGLDSDWLIQRWTVDHGLPIDHVNDLALGSDGRLWLATFDGLVHFDGRAFSAVPLGGATGLPSPRVMHVERQPGAEALWVAFEDGRLQRRGADGVRTFDPLGPGGPSMAVAGGALWYTAAARLFVLEDEPRLVSEIPGLHALWVDAGGRLWAELAAPVRFVPLDADGRPQDDEILDDLDPPDPGVGPWRHDSHALTRDGRALVRFEERIQDVLAVDDALWVATRGEGLVRVAPRPVDTVLPPDGLSPRIVRLRWEPSTQTLWARSELTGWWAVEDPERRLDPPGLHEPAPGAEPLPPSALPFSLDGRGRWWATQGRVVREDPETGRLEELPDSPTFWEAIEAWRAPDGQAWLAARSATWRWDGAAWHRVRGADGGDIGGIRSFAALPDGSVLLGGFGGLGWVGPSGDRVVAPRLDEQPHVRHVRVDGGRVWVATEERGLCAVAVDDVPRRLRATEAWRCLGPDAGLGTFGVHASIPDARGRIWVSANRGLGWAEGEALAAFARGERDRVDFLWRGRQDGMRSAEANGTHGGTAARTPDGALWFPTQQGVARLDPLKITPPGAPEVRISGASVDGEPVHAPQIAVPSPQAQVEIAWAGISLDHASAVVFRSRLGPDGAWSEPSAATSVLLKALPPGEHRFEVQAGLAGRWGPVAAVPLRRPPTLLERPVAWLGGAMGTLGLVVLGGLGRLSWARRRRLELEAQVGAATARLRRARDVLVDHNTELDRRAVSLNEKNALLRSQAEELRALYEHSAAQAERLTELDRVKRRLLANVSHELRTPLALILGPLGAAREAVPPGAPREAVDLALRNARRLEHLVGQLLELARAQSGALPLRARRGPLGARVARVLGRFPADEAGAGIRFDRPADDPVAWCDPEMLDTIVGNLVSNAREHGSGEVAVRVDLDEAGGVQQARVTVRDHGPGVPPEQAAHLFDRFRQAERSTTGGGLGLGLALVRELVELHGGEVGVEAAEGGGAGFWFTLPLGVEHLGLDDVVVEQLAHGAEANAEPGAVAEPDGDAAADPGTTRVLFVEDNVELRTFLASHLRTRFEVRDVGTAEAGLDALQDGRFSLVLSDIMLPGMSGLDLARRVRAEARWRDLPVLLVSAKGSVDDRVEGLSVADDYLAKPFQVRELLARCDALLRRGLPVAPGASADGASEPGSDPAADPDPAPELAEAAAGFLADLEAAADRRLADSGLGVDALASEVGVSRRNLHDRMTGLGLPPPGTWLRERRLDHAEDLLRRGAHETVGEVAAAVGMSRSYFSRAFKARTGRSPGAIISKVDCEAG